MTIWSLLENKWFLSGHSHEHQLRLCILNEPNLAHWHPKYLITFTTALAKPWLKYFYSTKVTTEDKVMETFFQEEHYFDLIKQEKLWISGKILLQNFFIFILFRNGKFFDVENYYRSEWKRRINIQVEMITDWLIRLILHNLTKSEQLILLNLWQIFPVLNKIRL